MSLLYKSIAHCINPVLALFTLSLLSVRVPIRFGDYPNPVWFGYGEFLFSPFGYWGGFGEAFGFGDRVRKFPYPPRMPDCHP
ncbi:hypothetical protein RHMOL_Rhmol04G0197300 [Rhododendron molle]|uniref:Uncharacterized protein n=1 Tax=Rhododendron molle TaxID=49168 RepID=A0ACC0P3X8_RHOML|nr:hypothetical protein RHMOL_Rhmol04G0197300 [Rhododendron molle]